MKRRTSFLALLLVAIMLLGSLASCTTPEETTLAGSSESTETTVGGSEDGETTVAPQDSDVKTEETKEETEADKSEVSSETDSENASESASESASDGASDCSSESASDSESKTESTSEEYLWPEIETEKETLIVGDEADVIERADHLANGVQAYHKGVDRDEYVIENTNMTLTYPLVNTMNQQVSSLTTKDGRTYITDTMDVFVTMTNGKTYYASQSVVDTATNIYRLGYYFYETRLENQIFVGGEGTDLENSKELPVTKIDYDYTNNVTVLDRDTNENSVKVRIDDANDPGLALNGIKFSADKCKYLQFTIKAGSGVGSNAEIFIIAGSKYNYTSDQRIEQKISADGQYHTYTVALGRVQDYTGNVKGIRFDINGKAGSEFEIKDVKAIAIKEDAPADLTLCRSFLAYSDKLHHTLQVAASRETENISQIGMITRIPVDRVESLVIKDRGGLKYSLEDKIGWNKVEYFGFLIKGVGVFGYTMPYDGKGGNVRITIEDGNYVIRQYYVPMDGVIRPSEDGTGNANDFYLGQRIYTDTERDFAKFIIEAECETHPLDDKNFVVNPLRSGGATYAGYDSLRGAYKFNVDAAAGFNGPYFEYPNRHFGVEFDVKGDSYDREIYVMTYTTSGSLECAAILDNNRMMLPIPIEVAKNFRGDGENNIFMKDDATYGETVIPLIISAEESTGYSILNLYQNWGRFPLKQISSIQFFSPYYHLSMGVTETNCVVPFGSNGLSLPDFRSMSAPHWKSQPQHNSCGTHSFVRYYDTEGIYIANQLDYVYIDSYGPTYADMTTVFYSDDGKIKITYNHMEQPQDDENRTFYQLKLEILGDLTLNNFKEDFYLYNVTPNDPTGVYQKVGYLNDKNESVVVSANKSGTPVEYILGDKCPYFSFFDMDGYTSKHAEGYSNVAMMVYNSEFIIGGEKRDVDLVLRDMSGALRLTLDLGNVTFNEGDSLTLNGILLPWGSQEYEDGIVDLTTTPPNYEYDMVLDDGTLYMDKNVRDVRADSLLNPLKAIPVENCETASKSVGIFLPEIATTNGKSATFKLEGGNNNVAVRAYGFNTLTVPKIERLNESGEWEAYEVSSVGKRDQLGYGYSYDGYGVNYDGDGTYSYSFVVKMDEGAAQTFRITADSEFKGWGEEKDPTADLPLNVYIEPGNMADLGASIVNPVGCTYEIDLEGGFFRFYGMGENMVEGYFTAYSESPLYPTTGQYFVFKYRLPTTNKSKITYFDVFTSTEGKGATGSGDTVRATGVGLKDGLWHVVVIDLSAIEKYTPNRKGEYIAKFLRFDVMNSASAIPETDYIDIAYYGFSDNLADICKLNAEESELMLWQDATLKKINPKTEEVYVEKDPINYYFNPSEMMGMTAGGCDSLIASDGSFVRFSGRGADEGYVFPFENSKGNNVTGQYFIVKYRIPTSVAAMAKDFEIFASTELGQPNGNSRLQVGGILPSDEWRVLIVDLSQIATYNAVDGNYSAKHVRFDVINGKYTHTEEAPSFIDVAYMGLHGDLSALLALNKDMEYITVVGSDGKKSNVTPDGLPYQGEEGGGEVETDPPAPPAVVEGINVEVRPSSFDKPSGCTMTVAEDGSYARFTATGSGESYLTVYKNTSFAPTGRYFAVKYKIPTGVTFPTNFQIYASTQNTAAEQNGGKDQFLVGSILPSDDWQLLIVDLSQISTFTKSNGQFTANYVRFDVINGKYTHSEEAPSYIDIEFFAINDTITEILEENTDLAQAVYVDKNGTRHNIPTDGSFKEPVDEGDRDNGDPLNVYATPDEMDELKVRSLTKSISEDGKYYTYTATGAAEGSVWAYKNSAGDKATGQYFVVKYRVPSSSVAIPNNFELFVSTSNSDETGGDSFQVGHVISDGEWHVMIIDLSRGATFNESEGEYFAKYVRFDIFNGKRDNTSFVDVEYFGLHDDLNEIYALNSDMESVTYVDASGNVTNVDPTPDAK